MNEHDLKNEALSEKVYVFDKKNYTNYINFLVIGRPGAGKSSLINGILGQKRCLERPGKSATSKSIKYRHDKYPLAFYDTKGFESKEDRDIIYKYIKDMNKSTLNNDVIHMVIYVMNANDSRISDKKELEFLKKINLWLSSSQDKDISNKSRNHLPLIFVHTHANDQKRASVMKRELLSQLSSEIQFKDPHIFSIELYGKNAFGLDILFTYLHKYFKKDYISNDLSQSIAKSEDNSDIINMLSSSRLLSKKKSVDDIIDSCEYKAYFIIITGAALATAIGAIPISIQDMPLIFMVQVGMVKLLGMLYGVDIQLDEAKKKTDLFQSAKFTSGITKGIDLLKTTLKIVPGIGVISSLIETVTSFGITLGIGISMMQYCKETLKKDGSKPYLIQAIEEFNDAIDSFDLLRKEKQNNDNEA